MGWTGEGGLWDKYKYAVLAAAAGIALLLWPAGRTAVRESGSGARDSRAVEREMEEILGQVSGVGQVRVMLAEEDDGERTVAQNTDLSFRGDEYSSRTTAVLVDGNLGDETFVVRTAYPRYRGALVVCQGGDKASVRLAVTQAVTALTGLSADRVAVAKWR